MYQLMAEHEPIKIPALRTILTGTIVLKNRDVFFVAIPGMGSDAILPFSEVVSDVQIGDTLPLMVAGVPDDADMGIFVSEKRAIAWGKLMQAKDAAETVQVTVKSVVTKGTRIQGLQAVCEGVVGFIPRSQMADFSRLEEIAEGSIIPAKVIKADPTGGRRGELVFSNKVAVNESTDKFLLDLAEGQVVKGVVKRILKSKDGNKEIGALVSIADNDFTAFLHRSEISDNHSTKPSDVFDLGQEIDAEILFVDRDRREAKLTYKRLLYKKTFESLQEGAVVSAEVLRFKDRVGYFVAIGEGFTALLPCSQVSDRRNVRVADVLKLGQVIDVVVISVDAAQGKAIVSYKEIVLSKLFEGESYTGKVSGVQNHIGVFVSIDGVVEGLLHRSELPRGQEPDAYSIGDTITVRVKKMSDVDGRKLIAWSLSAIES